MKLSLVTCTKRAVPHFEWSIETLNNQTFKDFEYIVIDGLYNERKEETLNLFKAQAKFPFLYIPDKPSPWLDIGPALSNARNTGFIFANGQQVVFCDDDCKLNPDVLEKHNQWAERGYAVSGTFISHQNTNPDGTWNEGIYGLEHRAKQVTVPSDCPGSWLYGANFSVPIDAATEVNGNDELYCGEMGGEDCDFGMRIQRIGCQTAFDPTCIVKFMASPGDANSINKPELASKDLEILLRHHPKERLLNNGQTHYSNEWLIQLLVQQPTRYWPLGNAFQLSDLRQQWQDYNAKGKSIDDFYKSLENWRWPYSYDWRDGELLTSMRDRLSKSE
jgi:glycosyltransferase involved in cell wall biosynthesis